MKKVLFVVHSLGIGGVEKILIETLNSVNKNKFDIKLAVNSFKENILENELDNNIKIEYIQNQKIIEKIENLGNKNSYKKIIRFFYKKYLKYITQKKYDLLSYDRDIIVDFSNGENIKKIKFKDKIKKICWIHGNIYNVFDIKNKRKKVLKRLRKFDKIICVSKEIKEDLTKEFIELNGKVENIYNSMDRKKILFKSNEITDLTSREKELLKKNYLLMVSRLDGKVKDFETLISAYEKYKKNNEEGTTLLYILGEGSYREKLIELIERKKLKNNILLLGKKLNPYPWIKNSKILIQSSKTEGLPTTLIEGLILKKLMIATDCKTGPREILDNGNLGVLVPVNDSEIMSEKIVELLEENSELKYKIENNLQNDDYLKKYDRWEVIKEIERVLEEK